jgi:hypothetical protein
MAWSGPTSYGLYSGFMGTREKAENAWYKRHTGKELHPTIYSVLSESVGLTKRPSNVDGNNVLFEAAQLGYERALRDLLDEYEFSPEAIIYARSIAATDGIADTLKWANRAKLTEHAMARRSSRRSAPRTPTSYVGTASRDAARTAAARTAAARTAAGKATIREVILPPQVPGSRRRSSPRRVTGYPSVM